MTARRRVALALAGLVIGLITVPLGAGAAFAHDTLIDANPTEGSTATTLTVIALTFSGAVVGGDGADIVQVRGPDERYYETACPDLTGAVVTAPVALGAAGTYVVVWRVVSSDGHPVSGSYAFRYEPGETARPAPAGSDTPRCGAAPPADAPTQTDEAGAGAGVWLGLAIGAAVAVIVGLIAWLLVRKVPRATRVDKSMGWNDDVIEAFRSSKGTENYWGPKLIILHSIGAKSGRIHLNPVVGFRNEHGWRVVASKGGTPENPGWYHNLRANPSIEIEALVDGEVVTVPVTVTEITGDEWREAYSAIAAEEPQFGEYLEKTDRRIPVLQLTPRAESGPHAVP